MLSNLGSALPGVAYALPQVVVCVVGLGVCATRRGSGRWALWAGVGWLLLLGAALLQMFSSLLFVALVGDFDTYRVVSTGVGLVSTLLLVGGLAALLVAMVSGRARPVPRSPQDGPWDGPTAAPPPGPPPDVRYGSRYQQPTPPAGPPAG